MGNSGVDGHDIESLLKVFSQKSRQYKPKMIVAKRPSKVKDSLSQKILMTGIIKFTTKSSMR